MVNRNKDNGNSLKYNNQMIKFNGFNLGYMSQFE